MKVGRPSKYDPRYCEDIIEYFDIEPFIDRDIPHMGKTGEFKWMDYKRMANNFPTFLGFAKKIGVNGDTLVEWSKVHEDFSAAYIRAKEIQKWILIENGLNGLYNPQFTIFVAKNITDMKDKNETDMNLSGNVTINMDELIGLSQAPNKTTGSNSTTSESSD